MTLVSINPATGAELQRYTEMNVEKGGPVATTTPGPSLAIASRAAATAPTAA